MAALSYGIACDLVAVPNVLARYFAVWAKNFRMI
jgi:hypothetical protein